MKTETKPELVPEEYVSDYIEKHKLDLSEEKTKTKIENEMLRQLHHSVHALKKRGPDLNEHGVSLLQVTIFERYCLLRDMGINREELNIAAGNKSPLASP